MIVETDHLRFRYQTAGRRDSHKRASGPSAAATGTDRAEGAFALDDLSFALDQAGLIALLGPNGSGKSTLFRILTTMVAPGAGRAAVCGFDTVREALQVRRQIGVVFQESSLDRKLSVRENLRFQGNLFGLSGAKLDERIVEAVARLDLEDRLDAPVHALSGGLRRRAEIAKALLHRPKLLLLDEPSTGLDPHARRDLWKYLRELHDESGTSVVAATHYLEEAERCHRVLILHEGRLVADGEPIALKRQVGGDVLVVESDHPQEILTALGRRSGMEATVVDGSLRMETPDGAGLVTELMASHSARIRELRMHPPTLEDVYFRATGKEFKA
ncbi:MAG: ABC transporter ATP-binding protein [Bryobacterales bacterium]|nr:ABC transporter ATP-binding protein [Bryobacterales bacterium]